MTEESFTLTSEAARELSQLGASKGGEARAKKLSAERRSEIARAAVEARWIKAGKEPLPKATHKGSFKEEFGLEVDCYVLNDDGHTAVISQRGMGRALGYSPQSAGRLPRLLRIRHSRSRDRIRKLIIRQVGCELKEFSQ